jgi:hypothetical protein
MADLWDVDAKVYFIQEDAVLKARVKRRMNSGEADYQLQNQKFLKVAEMHHTREDAERALSATGGEIKEARLAKDSEDSPVVDGAAKEEELVLATGGEMKEYGMPQDSEDSAVIADTAKEEMAMATGGEMKEDGMTQDSEDSAVVASAAKEDPDVEVGNMPNFSPEVEAEQFTRKVSEWLISLTSKALERGVFMPTILIEMYPLSTETRHKILEFVPWQHSVGYTTMLRRQVKVRVKGVLHVSSIHFGQKGFHGGGMYVGDAVMWLQQFDAHSTLQRLGRLDVAPVLAPGSTVLAPGTITDEYSLSAFGFGADGALANGTYLFALVALVLFALVHETRVPHLLVKFLQAIPVQHVRADSASARMVESMVPPHPTPPHPTPPHATPTPPPPPHDRLSFQPYPHPSSPPSPHSVPAPIPGDKCSAEHNESHYG